MLGEGQRGMRGACRKVRGENDGLSTRRRTRSRSVLRTVAPTAIAARSLGRTPSRSRVPARAPVDVPRIMSARPGSHAIVLECC